jgi:hypothetical protein
MSTGAGRGGGYEASIDEIGDELATGMVGVSWHEGCPVPLSALRLLTMSFWGFDGESHRGELVVHEDVAGGVVSVFGQLFAARFPIRSMDRIERFGGDDEASMAADNTSCFNCREIAGGGPYSIHSWGKAIDINPLENPYIKDGLVLPPAGVDFLDRGQQHPGMIYDGDFVVEAFAAIGFTWGGHWERLLDYQHFEAAVGGT